MSLYLWPIAFVLLAWWASTGAILWLGGLPRWTNRWTFTGATVLLGIALVGLYASRDDTRVTGAYIAFTSTLVVWGWQEIAFLLGYVTGPRRTPCPAGAAGWRRTLFAVQTLLHHEIALVVLGALVVVATRDGTNSTGIATFAIFWVMRLSAKLNIFLGVRNCGEDFLPQRLRYLQSYFRQAPINPLFPVSVIASSWIAVLLWQAACAHGIGDFEATALTLSGTLLSLAILEHCFMVLPLPSQALWGVRPRAIDRQVR